MFLHITVRLLALLLVSAPANAGEGGCGVRGEDCATKGQWLLQRGVEKKRVPLEVGDDEFKSDKMLDAPKQVSTDNAIVQDSVRFALQTLQQETKDCSHPGGSPLSVSDVVALDAEIEVEGGIMVYFQARIEGSSGHSAYHRLAVFWAARHSTASGFSNERGFAPSLRLPLENGEPLAWCTLMIGSTRPALAEVAAYGGHSAVNTYLKYHKMMGYLGDSQGPNPDAMLQTKRAECQASNNPPAEYLLRTHSQHSPCFTSAAVHNQGSCGSGWAFAAAHAMAGRLCMRDQDDMIPKRPCAFPFTYRGKSYNSCITEGHDQPWCCTDKDCTNWGNCNCPTLGVTDGTATCGGDGGGHNFVSVQAVLSCSSSKEGCDGGWMSSAFEEWKVGGAPLASDYTYSPAGGGFPWDSQGRACQWGRYLKPYRVSSYYSVSGAVDMQKELLCNGPFTVAFAVYANFFAQDWASNPIYSSASGDKVGGHAVVAVGYGTEGGVHFWDIMNSWGRDWADGGYCKFKRGVNLAGIEGSSVAPVVEKTGGSWVYGPWSLCPAGTSSRKRSIKCVSNTDENVQKPEDSCPRTSGWPDPDSFANYKGGPPCMFPFTYKGVTYDSTCTSEGHSQPWCYTDSAGAWGNCDGPGCVKKDGKIFTCGGSNHGLHASEVPPVGVQMCGGSQDNCTNSFCNGHGSASLKNGICSCSCDLGFEGDNCEQCAPSYQGYPTCRESCSRDADCSGHGDASGVKWKNEFGVELDNCVCECDQDYGGLHCDKKSPAPAPTPAHPKITTCGGNAGGATCMFPFSYNGVTYTSCTTEGHDQPWCYTDSANKWGNCNCQPTAAPTAAPTPEPTAAPTPEPTPDPTPDPTPASEITTCGGNAGGASCRFPFSYKGTTYTSCTAEAHDQPWCCTDVACHEWGNCNCQHATCGGNAGGAPCMFPFSYKGVTYTSCATEGHDQPWCYTDSANYWGNCNCD